MGSNSTLPSILSTFIMCLCCHEAAEAFEGHYPSALATNLEINSEDVVLIREG
jgi:hypothetical protein